MSELKITAAHTGQLSEILALLRDSALPVTDIADALPDIFSVVLAEGRIIACGGIEKYQKAGLLRSVAVMKEYRNQGIGEKLLQSLVEIAGKTGITALYLLTETAAGFFEKQGFARVDRSSAPENMQQSSEFSRLCPASAVCMRKHL